MQIPVLNYPAILKRQFLSGLHTGLRYGTVIGLIAWALWALTGCTATHQSCIDCDDDPGSIGAGGSTSLDRFDNPGTHSSSASMPAPLPQSYPAPTVQGGEAGATGAGGFDGTGGCTGHGDPCSAPRICFVDPECSDRGNPARDNNSARDAGNGECVDPDVCDSIWACESAATGVGTCNGGTVDCKFNIGCEQDVQGCETDYCLPIWECSDLLTICR